MLFPNKIFESVLEKWDTVGGRRGKKSCISRIGKDLRSHKFHNKLFDSGLGKKQSGAWIAACDAVSTSPLGLSFYNVSWALNSKPSVPTISWRKLVRKERVSVPSWCLFSPSFIPSFFAAFFFSGSIASPATWSQHWSFSPVMLLLCSRLWKKTLLILVSIN